MANSTWESVKQDVGNDWNAIKSKVFPYWQDARAGAAQHWSNAAKKYPTVAGFGRSAKTFSQSGFHKRGVKSALEMYGLQKGKLGIAGRAFGLVFLAADAYEGWKEEGAIGAVKGVARGAVINYAFGAIGIPLLKAAAVGAVAGVGAYAVASAMGIPGTGGVGIFKSNIERWKAEHKSINLGTPIVDPYGTGATMRSRSLQAIQSSPINGMGALGNEASLLYRPYNS